MRVMRAVGVVLMVAVAPAQRLWGAADARDAVNLADESVPPTPLPRVLVVGSTPLPGSYIERDQVATAAQVIDSADIDRTGVPGLTAALLANVAAVAVNDTEGNAFQPDILFRGFTASPVAGTPQGLAVYVNGARFNDAFGDTVNFDLIPPTAIQTVNLEAANPLFGLNALGGSVDIRLKNGFGDQGTSVTAYGGAYGRRAGILEFSRQQGPVAIYTVADVTSDAGFRRTSRSDLCRLYADLGWRSGAAEAHLGITGVRNTLGNPGATPVQALAADPASIFTAPNEVDNRYAGANLNGVVTLDAATSLQGLAYYQRLQQTIPNGTTAEVGPCDNGTGLLCNSDGTVVTGPGGQPVADFLHGGVYSGLSVQQLDSHAYGVSAQVTERSALGGRANHLVAGAEFNGSDSLFAGSQRIGGFDPYMREFIGPGIVQDQPGEGVNPVRVRSLTRTYGVFATDVLTLMPNTDLNLGAKFNGAVVSLQDELGGPVNGRHEYDRFNPVAGLTYRASRALQLYFSYSETNRAPTPQELSCANAATPCSLLNFFVGDPELKQVIARTSDAGVRGQVVLGGDRRVRWDADIYRTRTSSDILYEPTLRNPNLAFYTNAGRTQRQGLEASLHYDGQGLHVTLGYAYTDATFRSALLLNSTSNPAADAGGRIGVGPGDRIPGIPRHRGNLVVDYDLTTRWRLGVSARSQSNAYRFGDEANLTRPVSGYSGFDLNASYRSTDRITVFVVVDNVLDKRFYTYGSFGPVGDVPWPAVAGGVTDPRTASPGTPRVFYAGVRVGSQRGR